jgi:serine/threonine protein kinase
MMCRKSNKTRVLKLIDFGLSFKGTSSQLYAGTPIFIAPEIWQKREYNQVQPSRIESKLTCLLWASFSSCSSH